MELQWQRLEGRSGHEAGLALLEKMYRERTGSALPRVQYTLRGKPYFEDGKLHFSVSHTKDRVFCCLCHEPVGMDAEPADRPVDLALAKRWLSDREQEVFSQAEDPAATLLRFWVLKESYAKLTGRGWGNYLKNTCFDPYCPQIQIIDGCFVAVLTEKELSSCCLTPMPM